MRTLENAREALNANLLALAENTRNALDDYASIDYNRSNSPLRFAFPEEYKADNETAEKAFNALLAAHEEIRAILKARGIEAKEYGE
jgi:hypothetical protein